MSNSKRKQIFCNQLQLFQDQKIKHVPLIKLVKVEQPKEDVYQESSAEDIFQQMGQIKSSKKESENRTTKTEDWKTFYNQRLKELKTEKQELNHNQLTQLISEEWKQIKKQVRKPTSSMDEDFLTLNKKKQKKMKESNKNQEYVFSKQESDQEIDFNIYESAQFIEKLRSHKFKLVVNDITYELLGNSVIEAIQNNQSLIYLSDNTNNNSNTAFGTPNEKMNAQLDDIGSDSEQSICKGNDDFIIQNKIRSYL